MWVRSVHDQDGADVPVQLPRLGVDLGLSCRDLSPRLVAGALEDEKLVEIVGAGFWAPMVRLTNRGFAASDTTSEDPISNDIGF